MTTAEPSLPVVVEEGSPFGPIRQTWWDRVEAVLERGSEWLNPILVKESRQALKSRQFMVTFALLLVCGWGWSLLGVALLTPGVYYAPGGRFMLVGYYLVLAFPLLVIVPFSAFRSLASEREDGTYELLSITTLAARQIIGGKLSSAVLQMLVYLSALSPCLAFTYLLRGIDIITIVMLLGYTFLGSLLLSVAGLVIATVTRAKTWQAVLSVVMILGLVLVYFWSSMIATGIISQGSSMPYDNAKFWVAQATVLSGYASYVVVIFLAAMAAISFPSDNRSTKLRIAMLAQYVLLAGWIAWYWVTETDNEILSVFAMLAGIHWFAMGALMTGESPQLSPRVKRNLPKSFLGRVFLTWFNPGPGTGYLFAVSSMFSALVLLLIAASAVEIFGLPTGSQRLIEETCLLSLLMFCYVTSYLGLGRLLIMFVRRVARVGVFLAILLQVLLLLIGTVMPLIFQLSLSGAVYLGNEYTPLQITNPFWTLVETMDGDILGYDLPGLPAGIPVVPLVLVISAGLLLLVNLIATAGEVQHEREAVPERIEKDELELHPEKAPPPPPRSSPWDD